jgi:predicted phage terminase large subunit-like protein
MNGRRNVTGKSWKRTSDFFETVGHGGYLYSVGVGGATTGRAADIFIVDDPIKDMKQAYSPTYRKGIMDWYNSVALTRMSLDGHIVIMHTRWHQDDLAGQLLKKMKEEGDSTQWEVISIPATGMPNAEYRHPLDKREQGEALWPAFKGNEETLAKLRVDVGEKTWSSLYQQSPTIEGGNIIKDEWIHYYTELPFRVKDMRHHNTVCSWDMSFKATGGSFVVCLVIVLWEEHFYVVDCHHKKIGFADTLEAVQDMKKKYPFSTIIIEDKANGTGVIDMLKKKIPGIIAIEPDASKDERLEIVSPLFKESRVLFPFNASWTKEVIDELQSFPNGTNDDIVDAISQGLRHFNVQKGIRHLKASTKW